jgi:hypothetical protein
MLADWEFHDEGAIGTGRFDADIAAVQDGRRPSFVTDLKA